LQKTKKPVPRQQKRPRGLNSTRGPPTDRPPLDKRDESRAIDPTKTATGKSATVAVDSQAAMTIALSTPTEQAGALYNANVY
jgi:hypothetical protein